MYYMNFLATDVDVGKPIIDLVDDATSWHTGIMIPLMDPFSIQYTFTTQWNSTGLNIEKIDVPYEFLGHWFGCREAYSDHTR